LCSALGAGTRVSAESAGLLATLLESDRADCLVPLGEQIADDGLARLARLVLLDRAQNSRDPQARAQAEWMLRYRLPDHDTTRRWTPTAVF